MPTPQTTDEIAAYVRAANRANPDIAAITRPPANQFAALITERLPDLDPVDIAAVLLHASSFLATTLVQFRQGGLDDHRAAVMVVNIVAHAGERMDRQARRAADGPKADG